MGKIRPVILSGGTGTRLWPVSRESLPKQFAPLFDGLTLFQQTVRRVQSPLLLNPEVISGFAHRFITLQQLKEEHIKAEIYLEPKGNDTAPAIFAASLIANKRCEGELLLILPADHYIQDKKSFLNDVMRGKEAAENGSLIVFGVNPLWLETGYGYIEVNSSTPSDCDHVNGFIEKPNKIVAKKLFEGGNHLWNSGILLFRADVMLKLAAEFQPEMLKKVHAAVLNSKKFMEYTQFSESDWGSLMPNSIDYAIMEKAQDIKCVRLTADWSDLGDWGGMKRSQLKDIRKNVITQNSTEIDCTNTMLWSSDRQVHIAGLGLKNITVVASKDAVLVADADSLQDVKKIVSELEKAKVPVAKKHLIDCRPWGWFECLTLLPTYQVKRLHVFPGASLSFQSHKYRSEHWVVVSGEATVRLENDTITLSLNESIFIDFEKKHSLSNKTAESLVVIEVQTGSYLGEDDIVRYEDIYQR